MSILAPTFCRLEYLTSEGWVVGHHGINLLHPERYVERLRERGKFGRVTVIDTGQVYEPDELPDPAAFVPSDTHIPRVATVCPHCDEKHDPPFTGMCLL